MAEDHPEQANKPLTAAEPANRPAKVNPVVEPAQYSQRAGLMTPLSALWPTATLPGPSKPSETAVPPTACKTVKVTFVLHDPGAKQVSLCGEFNGWACDATPMTRQGDGPWETTIALAPGRHEYKFLVDGDWKHDPLARVNVWNQNGTLNSVAQVRP